MTKTNAVRAKIHPLDENEASDRAAPIGVIPNKISMTRAKRQIKMLYFWWIIFLQKSVPDERVDNAWEISPKESVRNAAEQATKGLVDKFAPNAIKVKITIIIDGIKVLRRKYVSINLFPYEVGSIILLAPSTKMASNGIVTITILWRIIGNELSGCFPKIISPKTLWYSCGFSKKKI